MAPEAWAGGARIKSEMVAGLKPGDSLHLSPGDLWFLSFLISAASCGAQGGTASG